VAVRKADLKKTEREGESSVTTPLALSFRVNENVKSIVASITLK